jgi:hypothetical protein
MTSSSDAALRLQKHGQRRLLVITSRAFTCIGWQQAVAVGTAAAVHFDQDCRQSTSRTHWLHRCDGLRTHLLPAAPFPEGACCSAAQASRRKAHTGGGTVALRARPPRDSGSSAPWGQATPSVGAAAPTDRPPRRLKPLTAGNGDVHIASPPVHTCCEARVRQLQAEFEPSEVLSSSILHIVVFPG